MKNKVINSLANRLDLGNSHIIASPNRIFLCGGENKISTDGDHMSRRSFFMNYLNEAYPPLHSKILLAETVNRAFSSTVYSDLLSFEKDLASLCALTVLFAESPGSLAELGAFSVLSEIGEKLVVALDYEHYEPSNSSFIWHGPIRFMKGKYSHVGYDQALKYRWNKKPDGMVLFSNGDAKVNADNLAQYINDIIEARPSQIKFKSDNIGHRLLLICQLLNLVGVATENDVMHFLKDSSAESKPSRGRVKQYMQLLSCIGLVKCYPIGTDYYCSSDVMKKWVNFGIRNGENIVFDNYLSDSIENYRSVDTSKLAVWKKHLGLAETI